MGRKRKLLTGVVPIGGPSLKSRKKAREVTSQYHSIRNEIEILRVKHNGDIHKSDSSVEVGENSSLKSESKKYIHETDRASKIEALEQQLVKLGGTNSYQQASIISTQHFKTSRWVLGTIEQLLGRTRTLLSVLEVGAINTQLQKAPWLDVRSIDVHSQHPLIEELDFFHLKVECNFDVCVSSMVVNCVPQPSRRGEMLLRMRCVLARDDSVLLLVLPARCVDSPHLTLVKQGIKKTKCCKGRYDFLELLRGLGFIDPNITKCTPRLVFYSMRRGPLIASAAEVGEYPWQREAKYRLQALPATLRQHFSLQIDGQINPKEFAIGFAPEFWK
eukprot:GSChrysophyteH1.ASY1.ANO1.1295.1 assembled CDS